MKTRLLLLSVLLAAFGFAQSVFIRAEIGNNVTQVANGGTLAINTAGVGRPVSFKVIVTYVGSTTLTILPDPVLLGSQDFSVTVPPVSNTILNPNQSITMELRYLPTGSRNARAEVDLNTVEAGAQITTSTGQVITSPSTKGLIAVGLSGTAPEIVLAAGFATDGNLVPIPAGGEIAFPDTAVNSANVATTVLVNRGSGEGRVQSVTISGEAFSLASLPFLPMFMASGTNSTFQVVYRPRKAGEDTGTLTLTLDDGLTYASQLKGHGLTSLLSYELLPAEGPAQPILPDQVIQLPSAQVGGKSTAFLRIRNASSLDLTLPISSIVIAGAAFQLSDVPFLPVAIAPNGTQMLTITFAPTQPGKSAGRLRIGNDSFELSGEGIGPSLTYSYRSVAGVTPILPLGAAIFPGVQVGQTSSIEFALENTGSAPAPIINVAIVSDGKASFTFSGLPVLPVAVAPNSSLKFTVHFAPLNTGLITASLRINTDAFSLQGNGVNPEPLPDHTLSGPTTVQPFEQPAISLTLASAYAVSLTGTITLSVQSDSFVADPSTQFATGGRVVAFTIPEGSTKAVFSNGSTSIKFQTGSVAGTLVLTPEFTTEGGLTLTPQVDRTLRVTLAAAAPKLSSLSIDSRTPTGFVLQAVGFATTRTLTKATVTFKVKPGFTFPKTDFNIDLTAASFLWFSGQQSTAYGGQFLLQLPFTLSTSDRASDAQPPVQALESVTVTVTNDKGDSNAQTTAIQ